MNRKGFLKMLGIGVAAGVVAPSVFIKQENTKFITAESLKEPVIFTPKRLSTNIKVSDEFMNWATTTCAGCWEYDENGKEVWVP